MAPPRLPSAPSPTLHGARVAVVNPLLGIVAKSRARTSGGGGGGRVGVSRGSGAVPPDALVGTAPAPLDPPSSSYSVAPVASSAKSALSTASNANTTATESPPGVAPLGEHHPRSNGRGGLPPPSGAQPPPSKPAHRSSNDSRCESSSCSVSGAANSPVGSHLKQEEQKRRRQLGEFEAAKATAVTAEGYGSCGKLQIDVAPPPLSLSESHAASKPKQAAKFPGATVALSRALPPPPPGSMETGPGCSGKGGNALAREGGAGAVGDPAKHSKNPFARIVRR